VAQDHQLAIGEPHGLQGLTALVIGKMAAGTQVAADDMGRFFGVFIHLQVMVGFNIQVINCFKSLQAIIRHKSGIGDETHLFAVAANGKADCFHVMGESKVIYGKGTDFFRGNRGKGAEVLLSAE